MLFDLTELNERVRAVNNAADERVRVAQEKVKSAKRPFDARMAQEHGTFISRATLQAEKPFLAAKKELARMIALQAETKKLVEAILKAHEGLEAILDDPEGSQDKYSALVLNRANRAVAILEKAHGLNPLQPMKYTNTTKDVEEIIEDSTQLLNDLALDVKLPDLTQKLSWSSRVKSFFVGLACAVRGFGCCLAFLGDPPVSLIDIISQARRDRFSEAAEKFQEVLTGLRQPEGLKGLRKETSRFTEVMKEENKRLKKEEQSGTTAHEDDTEIELGTVQRKPG